MFPVIEKFPEFVPDQLLTSENLNELFDFPDEQGRLTRTNLIGIGVVCGLEPGTASVTIKTGIGTTTKTITGVTISKGCGITSEGYLASFQDAVYTRFQPYDALTEKRYAPFLLTAGITDIQRFPLLELKKETDAGAELMDDLSKVVLNDKVVLLFVELLEDQNKNCNPNSCDDKGVNITLNLRPMLVLRTDAAYLIDARGKDFTDPGKSQTLQKSMLFDTNLLLPELRMPRITLAVKGPEDTTHADIVSAFKSCFGKKVLGDDYLVTSLQKVLTTAYDHFKDLVINEFPSNPFATVGTQFGFLSGTLNAQQSMHIQYYYDLFCDLLQAYQEFRKKGTYILSTCCPDSTLFPRHLLLGEMVPATGKGRKPFRHYFIHSPLYEQKDLAGELKSLFRRMVSIVSNFREPQAGDKTTITPSSLGCELGQKAIPYYYKVNNTTAQIPLFRLWNHERARRLFPEHNLSYHAGLYNSTDEFVKNPLDFDLESYDFFRVEGIIGKKCSTAVEELKTIVRSRRLPMDVIPLRVGNYNKSEIINQWKNSTITDLEINYDMIRREWEAVLGKTIEYLDDYKTEILKVVPSATIQNFKKDLVSAKDYMKEDLWDFAAVYDRFIELYESIETQAEAIRKIIYEKLELKPERFLEDLVDHIDVVTTIDKKGSFRAVMQEYDRRVFELMAYHAALYRKMFFADYVADHPGVDHKAGVNRGGTFIVVYDKRSATDEPVIADFYLPYRCCSDASPVQVLITEPNKPPVANAGGDQLITLPLNHVTLTGTATDPDGNIMATWWSKKSGPANYFIETPEDLVTKVSGLIPGVYVFELKIMDNRWDSHKDSVTITVNEPPVANAGEDKIYHLGPTAEVMDIVLNGTSSSDPEGKQLTYEWSKTSGPEGGPIVAPTNAITTVKDLPRGAYEFQLKVVDDKGAMRTDTVKITVNMPPQVYAGEDLVVHLPSDAVLLKALAKDIDGTVANTLWTKKAGPAGGVIQAANALETKITGLQRGTYQFELVATDNLNATGKDAVSVIVNAPPVVTLASRFTITMPTSSISISASVSDADGGTLISLWNKLAGGAANIQSPDSTTTVISGLEIGWYTFELTVTDDKGAVTKARTDVEVRENKPPKAVVAQEKFVFQSIPPSLILDGSRSTDPEGVALSYNWRQTEGPRQVEIINSTKAVAEAFGFTAGLYRFELTVRDDNNSTSTAGVTVVINMLPTEVSAGEDQKITSPESTVTLTGRGKDPEGGAIKFEWTKIAGPHSFRIESPMAEQTRVMDLVIGTYEFRLSVTDNNGGSVFDTVLVIVHAPTKANAGADKLIHLPANSVVLDGNASTGALVRTGWKYVSGPDAYKIEKPESLQTVVSGLVGGTYEFQLVVTDEKGISSADNVRVLVNRPPEAVVETSEIKVTVGESAELAGSGSDADGRIAAYNWQLVGKPDYAVSPIITDPSAQQTAVGSFGRVGKYYFQLTVTDDKGATGVASVVVTVIRRYINLDPLQPFIPFEPINSLDPIHRFDPTKPPVLPK